jgi:hypothetical protein
MAHLTFASGGSSSVSQSGVVRFVFALLRYLSIHFLEILVPVSCGHTN